MPTVAEKMEEMEQEPAIEQPEGAAPDPAPAGFDWWAWLRSPTGEGAIESYGDHPFNVTKNVAGARIVRGLTGLFGNLNFAAIDVFMGLVELWRGRQVVKPAPEDQ
jgi:hypothetical protein